MIVGAVLIGIFGGLASAIATLLLGGTILQAFVVYSVGGSAVVVLSAILMMTSSLAKESDTTHGRQSSASLEA